MNESTNFGLKTTGDNDQWRNTLDYHNENMGVIDAVLANNQNALGIIVDGNKAAVSATTGQYIILRNSTITGKTDGLYTAAKSIPANTAIDGTYLTAVSGGGLNALNGKLTRVQANLTPIVTPTRADIAVCYRNGGCCTILINNVSFGSSFSSDTAVFRCPYIPPAITRFQLVDSSGALLMCFVDPNNGDVKINGYTAGRLLYGSVTYVV